jgi:hypothetical protein
MGIEEVFKKASEVQAWREPPKSSLPVVGKKTPV